MSRQYELNKELAQMLKGGVIMDVTTPEQAKIAEAAGACAVMALERIPADIRAAGGVSRMSDPKMIRGIQEAVSIPVMAKCRIGHFVEAQILEAIEIDYIDESKKVGYIKVPQVDSPPSLLYLAQRRSVKHPIPYLEPAYAAMLVHNGLCPVQAEAVCTGLPRPEEGANLLLLLPGAVEKIEIEHIALHPQRKAEEFFTSRAPAALDGIVQQIPDDNAQLQIGERQLRRQIGLRRHGDPGGAGLRELGRKNGIDGHIAGLEQGVDRLQAPVQLLEVDDGPVDLPGLQLGQGEHGAAAPCGQCGDHGGIRSGGQQEVPLVLGLPQGIQGGGDCGGLGI